MVIIFALYLCCLHLALNIYKGTYYKYIRYRKATGHTLKEIIYRLLVDNKVVWFASLGEEILFRLPLIYYPNNNYVYYISNNLYLRSLL